MKSKTFLVKLGKRIKLLRKIHHISQERLAEKSELHPNVIGHIERGETNPTVTTLEKIAAALNVSIIELFTFAGEKASVDSDINTLNKALKLLDLAKELGKTE